ncbi:MAG: T9SS type A sorting domain-containing protein [Bacteroidia bacterium]
MKKHIYLLQFIFGLFIISGSAIAQPLSAVANTTQNVTCNGQANGAVTCTASYGTPPYTYSWAPGGATTQSVFGLAPGIYTVTVTDAVSANTTATTTITQPAVLTANNSGSVNICAGSGASISGTGVGGTPAYIYSWAPSGGISCPTCPNPTASPATTTNYTVTVTDVNGCTANSSLTVTVNALPTVLVSPSSTQICYGASAVLTATGASTYSWNTGPTTSSINVSPLVSTTYTVTGTSPVGCTAQSTGTVLVSAPLSVSANPINITCFGLCDGSISATPSGGSAPYTYLYSPGGQTAVTATNLCAGTYTVDVTDNIGCIASTTVNVNQPLVLTINVNPFDASCAGACNGSANAVVSGGVGGYAYAWTPTGGTLDYTSSLCPGTYTFTATDANGCTANSNFNIYQPAALSASASATDVTCHGANDGTATVMPVGGTPPYNVQWGNFNGTTLTSLDNGMYVYAVTDGNGCTFTDSVLVTEPNPLLIGFTPTSATCSTANGSITAGPTGGTPPYSYFWSDGSSSAMLSNVPSGQYYVEVTDANNCFSNSTGTIDDAGGPSVVLNATVNVSCAGLSNGSILTTISGGTAPLSIQWMNGFTTDDLLNIPAGTYDLIVTDASGCMVFKTYTVTEPVQMYTSGTSVSPSVCTLTDGSASAGVIGGTSPYNYLWDAAAGLQTTPSANGLGAGAYKVIITDNNGCMDSLYVAVSDPNAPSVVLDSLQDAGCLSSGNVGNGAIYTSVSGGVGPFNYLWSTGATTDDVSGLGKGIFGITVTDIATGCVGSSAQFIYGIQPGTPQLCLVTVDTATNHNIIVWEKDIPGIMTYYIYRESSVQGSYNLIATIPADSLSQYEDTLANANVQPWNYEIKVIDSCGITSVLSYNHQSIFLTVAQGSGSSVDLSWTDYLGTSFNYYYIYRKSNTAPWALIDSVAAGTLVYNDALAPSPIDSIEYLVEIIPTNPCNPTRAAINTSRSNIKNTSRFASGIREAVTESKATVFPNPAQSELNVKIDRKGKFAVQLYDVTGRKLNGTSAEISGASQAKINTSTLEPGVYILKLVFEDGKVYRAKFIKQ